MRNKVIIVNFGGPRHVDEVPVFLKTLLTDHDVIRTPLPDWIQDILFRYIAKKRSPKIAEDYMHIGGCSPIFADTEWLASSLKNQGYDVLTFHRYLPMTHEKFLEDAHEFIAEGTVVFPLFPQFSYATTGSIARWMKKHLCARKSRMLSWVKSYSEEDGFILPFANLIKEFMKEKGLEEKDSLLFFSPHGLPASYVFEGDIYKKECERSCRKILQHFPSAGYVMGYQSQFGKGEWIKPYTNELADRMKYWNFDFSNVIFIPLSFTSDHIETLFEVEQQYVASVQNAGFKAFRCPALNRRDDWLQGVSDLIQKSDLVSTDMLIRNRLEGCACKGRVT